MKTRGNIIVSNVDVNGRSTGNMKNTNYSGEDKPIRLTKLNMVHTSTCNPSPSQFSQSIRRSGSILKLISPDTLNEVADILGIDEYISLPVARAYLKRIFPTNWVFDANTLHNFILKCRIFKSYSDTNKPILKPNMNKPGYLELVGISQQDLIDKSFMLSGQDLEDSLKNEDDTWIVKKLVHSLKTLDDIFDYRISTYIKGRPSVVVWVASTMGFN